MLSRRCIRDVQKCLRCWYILNQSNVSTWPWLKHCQANYISMSCNITTNKHTEVLCVVLGCCDIISVQGLISELKGYFSEYIYPLAWRIEKSYSHIILMHSWASHMYYMYECCCQNTEICVCIKQRASIDHKLCGSEANTHHDQSVPASL